MEEFALDATPSPLRGPEPTPSRIMVIRVGSVEEGRAFHHWRQRLEENLEAIGTQQAGIDLVIEELANATQFWTDWTDTSESVVECLEQIVEAFEEALAAMQEKTEKTVSLLKEVVLQTLPQPKTREEMDLRSVKSVSITELYRLRPHLVARALKNTKIDPQVDDFSLGPSKQCSRWWGPDSPEARDAFEVCWSNDILWLNPPYSMMQRVVDKLREDQAHAILVAPEWPTKAWWQALQAMVAWRWRIPAGSKTFMLYNRPCGPTRWPVQVMVICGADLRCGMLQLQSGVVHGPRAESQRVAEIKTTTCSKKRRLRRQRLKELRSKAT